MLEIKLLEGDSVQNWSPDSEEDGGIYIMRDKDFFGPFVWIQIKDGNWLGYEDFDMDSCTNCGGDITKREFYENGDMCQSCYDLEIAGMEFGETI